VISGFLACNVEWFQVASFLGDWIVMFVNFSGLKFSGRLTTSTTFLLELSLFRSGKPMKMFKKISAYGLVTN